jgi:hypothetical protein
MMNSPSLFQISSLKQGFKLEDVDLENHIMDSEEGKE